jgi:hypothetical protein
MFPIDEHMNISLPQLVDLCAKYTTYCGLRGRSGVAEQLYLESKTDL